MQVHDLKPNKKNKKKKRIGRGGKRGSFSGKGTKGQKKRAGGTTPSYTKELIKKFPKLRGVKNKSVQSDKVVINIEELNQKFESGDTVNKKILREKEMIDRKSRRIKILGDGEIDIDLKIEGIPTSSSAKAKIEEAGGSVTQS